MKCVLQLLIINALVVCFSCTLMGSKEEAIIECFKAIENDELDTVKKIIDDGLDVNSVLDLNNYFKTCTVKGESNCSLLEWARYRSKHEIYEFLSEHKEMKFKCAGFLRLDAGSVLPLNEKGLLNKQNDKNSYPVNHKNWPILKPIQITKENAKLLIGLNQKKCFKSKN